jgi:glutamyl-tRNA synthetase
MTRVRFAPSPTGYLHIGNLRPALINWLFALKQGGEFVLRFDDTDPERSRTEYSEAAKQDLGWIGIEPHLVRYQSERTMLYDAARERLIDMGRLYPCYETAEELDRRRKRARALGKPPIYDRAALELTDADKAAFEAEGRKPHWRFKLDGRAITFTDLVRGESHVNTATQSDPVLVREDGSYLYTLPSVVDDIEMGITHVIRGEDHVTNTGAQIELIEALGGTVPVFAHHNLLSDAQGHGLSKRHGALSLRDLRNAGYEAMAVAIMAVLTGTSEAVVTYADLGSLAEVFDLSKVSRAPARFDPGELDALNARLLHTMSHEAVRDRLAEMGISDAEALWLAARENISKLSEIEDWHRIVTGPVEPVIAEEDRAFLDQARDLLPAEPWDGDTWKTWTSALKVETGRKGRGLFLPLRLALTGRADGPELRSLLPVLGRRACLDRLS